MYNVHEQKRDHPCNVCGKKFSDKFSVKIHIQGVHQKVRFKCDICGNDFSQPSAVYLHKKNVHKIGKKTEESFKCYEENFR